MPEHHFGERVVGRSGPQEVGIQNRCVANSVNGLCSVQGAGRCHKMKELRIVNDLEALGVGEPFLHRLKRAVVGIVCESAGGIRFGRNFYAGNVRAKALVIGILRTEVEPDSSLLTARNRVEVFSERGGGIKRGEQTAVWLNL